MSSRPQDAPSRYVVGFDLGTTNSAVCYVDTEETPWRVRTFAVPQLVSAASVEARDTLPSFHYQPAPGEVKTEGSGLGTGSPLPLVGEGLGVRVAGTAGESAAAARDRLPPTSYREPHVVGAYARDQGTRVPGRMIHSAKSWLCHSGVDRLAPLLPWHGAADVERLSPVEVSARYLAHVRAAWDARFPRHPLAQQDFVLTLPASFDEIARELTVKAAALAGLPRVVLIEEPQAAFYAWIDAHRGDWDTLVQPGQKILICDIGGGTSDFTLIRVRRGADDKVQFHRVAVGEHLILGGDNFDLALAHHVEQKLGDRKLEPRQWAVLVGTCRQMKETMLGPQPPARLTISLPGSGTRLIGGAIQVEITREEVEQLVLDGFFPRAGLDEKPQGRRSGFQEFGLPYAPDAAVTRYLAAFLTAHRHVALEGDEAAGHDPARPDIVLFNGGVFMATAIRDRLLDVLGSWFNSSPLPSPLSAAWSPVVLDNERLDLAVARGAAYYGMVRRGQGVRIAAGLARTYYIGVEASSSSPLPQAGEGPGVRAAGTTTELAQQSPVSPLPSPLSSAPQEHAICLLPAGIEPGRDIELTDRPFHLLVSEPVEFPLYVSSTRLTDKPGELAPIDRERMTPLPPIRTVLQTRRRSDRSIDVHLHARLTEIGTLDLWCSEAAGRGSWRLQFDIRSATQTDITAHDAAAEREGFVDEATWEACRGLIDATFGPDGGDKPEGLVKRLAAATGMSRNAWPTSLCRRIWEALMDCEPGRRRSPPHETRWLNLLGFALRPGYGLAVDDWRVAETWKTLQGKFAHSAATVRSEGWILWRRIAGGLGAGQQQAVAEPLLGPIRNLHRQLTTGKGRGGDYTFSTSDTAEVWRLLGSLELLPMALKLELGTMLLDLLPKRKMEPVRPAMLWAVGRVAARAPLYGPLNAVVPADTTAEWLARLIDLCGGEPASWLAMMQIARRTDDRYRDIGEQQRDAVLGWMDRENAPQHFVELVRRGGSLDVEEQGQVFGESLPKGLRLA